MGKKICIIVLIIGIAEIIGLLIARWFFAKETGGTLFHPGSAGEVMCLVGAGVFIVLCILLATGIYIRYK